MNSVCHQKKRAFSYTQIIALGFLLLIASGTFLLWLPISSADGSFTPVADAVFTATSASCVTGLVVVDTCMHWSTFGKCVILCLIQIGGLGFMTIATQFFLLMRRKIGLRARETLSESINTTQIGGIVRLAKKIILGTLLFEGLGALLLSIRFCARFGFWKGLAYGIFHAVSAFCNAGFDLMGCDGAYRSLVDFAEDPLVVLTISGLITVGGIGFVVWDDVTKYGICWKKYHLHTKLVLTMSGVLTLGGTLVFLLLEWNHTGAGRGAGGRLLTALFDAITPRTAGFNTVDTAQLSDSSKLFTMFLMFIGGSPGSTAGGVKTTTLAVVLLYALSYVRNRSSFGAFGRRLHNDSLRKSSVVMFTNLSLALAAAMVIVAVDPIPLTDVLFEVFSAIGTVGMTTGITRDLSMLSRLLIVLLMYCGRVGSLSFAIALTEHKPPLRVRDPVEDITIG